MLKRLIGAVVEKWDWFIYHRAYRSLRRMCERNAGFAYLLDLHLRQWRKDNPSPAELSGATEVFYEAITGLKAINPDSDKLIVHGRLWNRSTKASNRRESGDEITESQCRGYTDGLMGITENPYPEGSPDAALWRAGQEAAAIALIDGGE